MPLDSNTVLCTEKSLRVDLILSGLIIKKKKKKGHQEAFGGDGYVYCSDCGDGFRGVWISPNTSNSVH